MRIEQTMVINCNNWRVLTYSHGYQVQRRINKTRWKSEGFYPSLASAVYSLFNQRILDETETITIKPFDHNSARSSMLELVERVESIADELTKGMIK